MLRERRKESVSTGKNRISEMIRFALTGGICFLVEFACLIALKEEWPASARKERELYEAEYSWHEMERRINELYDGIRNEIQAGKGRAGQKK